MASAIASPIPNDNTLIGIPEGYTPVGLGFRHGRDEDGLLRQFPGVLLAIDIGGQLVRLMTPEQAAEHLAIEQELMAAEKARQAQEAEEVSRLNKAALKKAFIKKAREERLRQQEEDNEHQDLIGRHLKATMRAKHLVSESTLEEYPEKHRAMFLYYIRVYFEEVFSTWEAIREHYAPVKALQRKRDDIIEQLEQNIDEQHTQDLQFIADDLEMEIARETKSCAETLAETRGKEFLEHALHVFGKAYNALYALQMCAYIRQKIMHKSRITGPSFNKHWAIWERAHSGMDRMRKWRKRVIDLCMALDENFVDYGPKTDLFTEEELTA